jgi:hypothetical protein
MMRTFARNVASGEFKSDSEAARAAKFKHPKTAAGRLKANPLVKAEIERQRSMFEAAEKKREEAMGSIVGKLQGMTRSEVEAGLSDIARDVNTPAMVRVRAYGEIASIKGMKITRTVKDREFEGRTEEELEYFAERGYWPEQSAAEAEHVQQTGSGDSGGQGGSQKKIKPN